VAALENGNRYESGKEELYFNFLISRADPQLP
jgi:hypothetical protein